MPCLCLSESILGSWTTIGVRSLTKEKIAWRTGRKLSLINQTSSARSKRKKDKKGKRSRIQQDKYLCSINFFIKKIPPNFSGILLYCRFKRTFLILEGKYRNPRKQNFSCKLLLPVTSYFKCENFYRESISLLTKKNNIALKISSFWLHGESTWDHEELKKGGVQDLQGRDNTH